MTVRSCEQETLRARKERVSGLGTSQTWEARNSAFCDARIAELDVFAWLERLCMAQTQATVDDSTDLLAMVSSDSSTSMRFLDIQ